MIEVGLSPKGFPRWISTGTDNGHPEAERLGSRFQEDWREGVFCPDAEKG